MKRIGLVTLYNSDNYGALLQAYALQESIKKNECECVLIQHNRFGKKLKSGKSLKARIKDIGPYTKLLAKNPKMAKGLSKHNKSILKNQNKKNQNRCFNFREEYFKNKSNYYYDSEELVKNYPPQYDAYVCGSDQIWNPSRFDGISPFFLDFGDDKVKRISYAPSIGVSSIPNEHHQDYSRWVKRFDYLSVREKVGCKAIEEASGILPECVLDPTFLLSKEEWDKIAIIDENRKEKYILCYFLGKENFISSLKTIKNLARKLNAGIVILPPGRHVLSLGITVENQLCGPKEFLGYIKNAEYVLTDSFHGTALSINFNKQFSTYRPRAEASFAGKFTRIDNILEICNLKNRVFGENEDATLEKINYDVVNVLLNAERDKSREYLKTALSEVNKIEYKNDLIELAPSEFCTGCSACVSKCNVDALSMVKNELGYWHPEIDRSKCVSCRSCMKVCPVLNKEGNKQVNLNINNYWAVYANDIKVRNNGSSGNAFKLLTDEFSKSGNSVIFGSTLDDDCYGATQKGTNETTFDKLQKSKYLESAMGDSIDKISSILKNGNKVFFCGTPCQVEGIRSALGYHEGLLLCDFICHGVPSSDWFKKYLIKLEEKYNSKAVFVDFRSKLVGWAPHCIKIVFENGKTYTKTSVADPYLFDFGKNKHLRSNCYNCNRVMNSCADITIGDYWAVKRKHNIENKNEGISVIRSNTQYGENLIINMLSGNDVFVKSLSESDVEYTFISRERFKPKGFNDIIDDFPMKPKMSKIETLRKVYYEWYIKRIKYHNRKEL